MKFMLMLYADEKAGAAIPKDEMARAMEALFAYRDALAKAGAFVATAALTPTWEARTIRMDAEPPAAGTLRVHDGPYAESREQFGGYFIIDVADMEEAVTWASRCPAAQWGPIEVRPYLPGF